MRAMYPFRRFLFRGSAIGRLRLLAALALLFVRALLPGGIMLDPISVATGDLTPVMCSGHGPMFTHHASPTAAIPETSPEMDMGQMMGTMDNVPEMSGMSDSHSHESMAADDGICPFSAALVLACVGVALAVVLFGLTRVAPSWSAAPARTPVRRSPHSLPLSRAPPLFS
ncbi:hypothetical protein [Caballeronia sp. LZ001]|uniref:hypothetical protein n=1 Tax=Caballeronia sp. LZ001 TaxID=3038553 RepID=UPI0028577511|nr:hypothetical protein [Caballeronia sp. LZ001]MDR5806553.1 hypothetical protein [Caballeronia sp. LZ001]